MPGSGSAAGPAVSVVLGEVAAAAAAALVLAEILHLLMRRLRRRSELAADLSRRTRQPVRITLVLAAVLAAFRLSDPGGRWADPIEHAVVIALIASFAWLVGATSFVVEDAALHRYPLDVPDNRHARRVRTQVTVVRRVTVAVLAAVAIGAALMTFPAVRAVGASLLASAGIAGVVLGLAAQSTLSNLFAGLQLAFSDWLRLDDVVVVEGEWGRVEDITLSYVVVHLWDDRRLVFPTSYFTGRPFQNWTRHEAALLGTVELDVDWSVPVEAMREELHRIVESTQLWDGRVSVLQVTDAVGGYVRVRALVSAADAPTDWDLRCLVRERLVTWLQQNEPRALPRTRVDLPTDRGAAPEVPGPEVPGPEVPGPEVPGPEVPGPEVPGPEVPGPEVPGPEVPGPKVPAPKVPAPARDGQQGGRSERGATVFSGSADGEERGATFAPRADPPGR